MSSARKIDGHGGEAPAQETEIDEQAQHSANAQWLRDNPTAMPQVGAGRWAVYDRAGHLCGHLVGDGPTRDTRFTATAESNEWMPSDARGGSGITLHDAGAHLLDDAARGGPGDES